MLASGKMRFTTCAIFLHLVLLSTVDCQGTMSGRKREKPGSLAFNTNNNRADVNVDPDQPEDFSAKRELNETVLQESVMPTKKQNGGTGVEKCSCGKEMMALQEDLKAEANERLALKATVDNFLSELHNLQEMVYTNSSKLLAAPKAMAAAKRPFVAFSAKLSYNRELKPLDTVVFDTILTNTGSPYDADTGMFTATLSGTYLFHSTILSGYNTKVETAIIVNDKEVARIYSGAHDAHGSGSNMAVVDLRKGDKVWVRLLYQGGSHVHGYYSTFSGALLRDLE